LAQQREEESGGEGSFLAASFCSSLSFRRAFSGFETMMTLFELPYGESTIDMVETFCCANWIVRSTIAITTEAPLRASSKFPCCTYCHRKEDVPSRVIYLKTCMKDGHAWLEF